MNYSVRLLEKDREKWIDFRGAKPMVINIHYEMCTVIINDLNKAISFLKTENKNES